VWQPHGKTVAYRVLEDIRIGGYSVTWWMKARGNTSGWPNNRFFCVDRETSYSVSTATLEPAIAEVHRHGLHFWRFRTTNFLLLLADSEHEKGPRFQHTFRESIQQTSPLAYGASSPPNPCCLRGFCKVLRVSGGNGVLIVIRGKALGNLELEMSERKICRF
jgi:hypothetical protein